MQSVEKRLTVLLMRWAEQQRLGRPVSPEDLCRDCPDLLEAFKLQIEALDAVRSVLARDTQTAATHQPGTHPDTSTWGLMICSRGLRSPRRTRSWRHGHRLPRFRQGPKPGRGLENAAPG